KPGASTRQVAFKRAVRHRMTLPDGKLPQNEEDYKLSFFICRPVHARKMARAGRDAHFPSTWWGPDGAPLRARILLTPFSSSWLVGRVFYADVVIAHNS